MSNIFDKFEEKVKSYPILYQKAVKDLIKQTSKEFVVKYLLKCIKKQNEHSCPEEGLEWGVFIRNAIDWYLTTSNANPTLDDLMSLGEYPKVYLDKYGEKYLKEIKNQCNTFYWMPYCERVIDFLIRHNAALEDVIIEEYPRDWDWKDEYLDAERIDLPPVFEIDGIRMYLYIALPKPSEKNAKKERCPIL